MRGALESLERHARERPDAPAVCDSRVSLSYRELRAEVGRAATRIRERDIQVLGLDLDNGPAWAVWDLAAQMSSARLVPVPAFFTQHQVRHLLADAGVEAVLRPGNGSPEEACFVAGQACRWETLDGDRARVPTGTAKVTYTSGTTGRPKGVCLSHSAIERVVDTLAEATHATPADRHLALLPLSVLLENIGGLYVPLRVGALAILEPSNRVGAIGSSQLAPERMLRVLRQRRATTAITVPGQLEALVTALETGQPSVTNLRFLAVGGGRVSRRLLSRARKTGLPVYQGYGLSECASVVALNRPGDDDPDSVGRPLPHTDIAIAEDGEVHVRTDGFLGYVGGEQRRDDWWPTGDLGHLDARGRLHIHGRKNNVFVTAFGRNVSPEWVEAELSAAPAVEQSAVFGEARPWNSAVIVSSASDAEISRTIRRTNRELPDYAQVRRWLRADAPFSQGNGMATANGRLRREVVFAAYRSRLESPDHTKGVTP